MSFLQDPVWISICISSLSVIIPLITAIIIYRKSQLRKGIAYQVISNVPLFNSAAGFSSSVQILVHGTPLNDANVLVLKIWNSGNAPILPGEFIDPFTFNFGTGATVIDAEILEVIPSTINASVTKNLGNLKLDPLLLNSKDSIRLKVLLTGFSGGISIHTRIVGINQVQETRTRKSLGLLTALSTIIASSTMAALIAVIAAIKLGLVALLVIIAAIIPLFFGIIMIFIIYLLSRKH